MAECVSCGKEIPAGKFFCDDCYKKMKGRRGPLRRVAQPQERKPVQGMTGSAPVVAGGDELREAEEPTAFHGVQEVEKRPSGTLTPATSKKVVSLKPEIDKTSKDKGKVGKKKFIITITFSERTYMTLERLKRKRKKEVPIMEGEESGAEVPAVKPKGIRRKTGPHGRPKLKAVESTSRKQKEKQTFLQQFIKYQERKWDRGDLVSALMATTALVLTLVLCFLPWVGLKWMAEGGTPILAVNVKGIDLGALVYVLIVLTFLAWLYMAVTAFLKRPLLKVDFGLVLLAAGVIFIPIVFITLASNERIVSAALEIARRSGSFIPETATGYERQTIWPAYFMVLVGCVLAFSGLIRLSERGGRTGPEKEAE